MSNFAVEEITDGGYIVHRSGCSALPNDARITEHDRLNGDGGALGEAKKGAFEYCLACMADMQTTPAARGRTNHPRRKLGKGYIRRK